RSKIPAKPVSRSLSVIFPETPEAKISMLAVAPLVETKLLRRSTLRLEEAPAPKTKPAESLSCRLLPCTWNHVPVLPPFSAQIPTPQPESISLRVLTRAKVPEEPDA